MAEPLAVIVLRCKKREQIAAVVAYHETKLARARLDLAHVEGALSLFTPEGQREPVTRPIWTRTGFARNGSWSPCARPRWPERGPLTSKQLAAYVMRAKGMDVTVPLRNVPRSGSPKP